MKTLALDCAQPMTKSPRLQGGRLLLLAATWIVGDPASECAIRTNKNSYNEYDIEEDAGRRFARQLRPQGFAVWLQVSNQHLIYL